MKRIIAHLNDKMFTIKSLQFDEQVANATTTTTTTVT